MNRWPVAEKQRRLIHKYAQTIRWDTRNGFHSLLLRYGHTSIDNIPDWHAARRLLNGLRTICETQHKCARCDGTCTTVNHDEISTHMA